MSNSDSAQPRGFLHLKIYDAAGRLLDEWREENLVVTQGKQALALLLAGDSDVSSGEKTVTTIAFGSSATAPALTDTALVDQWEKNILGVAYPSANSVRFNFTLETTENNGVTIREFGLVTGDGSLFARKVRGTDIVKTSDVRLEGGWTITF